MKIFGLKSDLINSSKWRLGIGQERTGDIKLGSQAWKKPERETEWRDAISSSLDALISELLILHLCYLNTIETTT